MRTSPFRLISIPAFVAAGVLTASFGAPAVGAPSDTSSGAATSSGTASTTPDQTGGKHHKHQHHLLSQLNLTDAQKQQISELRQSVTDKKERHKAILKVLTPEQRVQLKELRQQRKLSKGSGSAPTASTGT